MQVDVLCKMIFQKDPKSKLAFAIRHAKRDEIVNITDSVNQSLTPKGRIDSINLGKKLPQERNYRLYFSNVPRCKETAQLILKGIKSNKNHSVRLVESKDFLSGFYLKESKKALSFIQKLGVNQFIVKWFKNEIKKDFIMSFNESSKILINSIINIMNETNNNTVNIFISHDWNLILLTNILSSISGKSGEFIFWPDFLESVLIEMVEEKNTFIHFRDLMAPIQNNLDIRGFNVI